MHVKKLLKVRLSEGGGVQLDFFLKGGILSWILLPKKILLIFHLIIHPQLICDQRGCVLCFCCIGRCML